MIRLWLSREQSIPLKEQLSAQLLLGIVSRRLPPGERLPSVRELARRLQIHANTVSAAYQDLAARGWVIQRKGSGVFVRDVGLAGQRGGIGGFVQAWIEAGAAQGFDIAAIGNELARIANQPRDDEYLVIDPDVNLARILATEMAEVLGYEVPHAAFAEAAGRIGEKTALLVLPAQAARAKKEFASARTQLTIVLRSMEDLLAGYQRPDRAVLVGLVTRSESIRKWSSTLLTALGLPEEAVLLRSPDKPQWKRGLAACHFVAADVEAFQELPGDVKGRVMRIVSAEFLKDLQESKRSA